MLQQKGKQTGGTTPAAVSFPMRSLRIAGGTGVPTSTLEKVARAPSPAFFPSPPQPGYIRRLRRSEAQFIIDGIKRRSHAAIKAGGATTSGLSRSQPRLAEP